MENTKSPCKVCDKKTDGSRICGNCTYLMKNGASEETIKRMLANDAVNNIWAENKLIAEKLAKMYYETVLEKYKKQMKKDTKENFGYNTFSDGVNMTLDIIIPLMDEDSQKKIKEKIDSMIAVRKKHEALKGKN